ncbi:MAG TPA: alpha-amylase family glycosyl hydrolase [Candidatus Saccharimonadales bacterium]|nr:alpha-amylase family glycosyl hydrolase [Candidatus Saccharimonadales bacterium]
MQQKSKKSETLPKHNWRDKTIYQIYPRSFHAQKNEDGNGDLLGIIEKLDYLQELGVDVIYLSPIYPSPMKDNGYDVENYLDINPMFGDRQTFDKLIASTHARDMLIMMDFVPNHTSDQHEWFKESRSSKDNPKRNWYHWRSKPNNWINVFDNTPGSAWTHTEETNEYYLHSFLKEQPDLNWDNPEVVEAMHAILLFWMGLGIDAFRIDAGLYVIKHPKFPDEPFNPDYVEGVDHPNEIYIHTVSKDQPRGFKKLADMGNLISERGGFSMQEGYIGAEERVMLYRLSENGLSVPLNFDLILNTNWNAQEVKKVIFDYYALLKDEDIIPLPLGNHDQSRVATRLGSQKDARLAAMLQMTLDCVPVIFQGEELGMEDVQIPKERQQDPFKDKLRDPARTPMQWDDSPNAGFTKANAQPWLPIGSHYRERNVKKELKDPQSMLSLYIKLLDLRKKRLIPQRPILINVNNDNVLSYTRTTADDKKILIVLNFSESSEFVNLTLEMINSAKLLFTTTLEEKHEEIIDFKNVVLNPKEGHIYLIENN